MPNEPTPSSFSGVLALKRTFSEDPACTNYKESYKTIISVKGHALDNSEFNLSLYKSLRETFF